MSALVTVFLVIAVLLVGYMAFLFWTDPDKGLRALRDVLAPGGTFVAKVLAGGAEGELQKRLKTMFTKVENIKPPASRSDSSEKFVVATGFRG